MHRSEARVSIIKQDKEPPLFLVSFRDITERVKLQMQLVHSEKMSAVGQIAAGVAHEFNNLLAIILGNTQLSKTSVSISEIQESLEMIETASMRGKALVRDLSAFSRPIELKMQPISICKVIDEIVRLQKKQLSLDNIKLKVKKLSCPKVLINLGNMEQVFANLFINSRHAIQPKKKGEISIIVKRAGGYVQIRFSDTGIGMDEETRARIFEPFFTTKGAYAKDDLKIQGSGLGLSLTYTIIQQHAGIIEVESEKGKGTTFIISLPVNKGPVKNAEPVIIKKKKQDVEKTKHLKVLIVDDEESIIRLMKSILKRAGHKDVVVKSKGKQALNALKTFRPDVIFLDLLMPDMDGYQVLAEIKKMKIKTPVVFISGKLGLQRDEFIKKGAFDLIKKPFDVSDVFEVLNRIVKMK